MTQKHLYGAVFGILEKGDKIAMLQRKNTNYFDGGYCFPAGHIEEGESSPQAMIREIKEEAGVNVSVKDLHPIAILHRLADREYFDVCYIVRHREGEPYNAEPQKSSGLFRFDKLNIPDYVAPEGKKFIEHYLTKGEELGFYILDVR